MDTLARNVFIDSQVEKLTCVCPHERIEYYVNVDKGRVDEINSGCEWIGSFQELQHHL